MTRAHAAPAARLARAVLRDEIEALDPSDRDPWVDRLLGLGPIPDDGPDLPRGAVPYLPAGVDEILEVVTLAAVGPEDRLIDVGAGVGRLAMLAHLLTGAAAHGVEVQAALVAQARAHAAALGLERVTFEHADARDAALDGDVLVLYAPFSGAILAEIAAKIRSLRDTRALRVATIDLALPGWPAPSAVSASGRVRVYGRLSR